MLEAKRIEESRGRTASQLTNDAVRVVVSDQGGMVPELSMKRENGYLNAHWVPSFRSNSGLPFDPKRDGGYWGGRLLYHIAGNFPCIPSFGMPGKAYGVEIEAHSATANSLWTHEKSGLLDDHAAFSVASLDAGDLAALRYRKVDLLLSGQPVHYTVIRVSNTGTESYRINAAWHNTVAPPFLEKGCLVDLCADRFATVSSPNEFDDTGRLEPGREFEAMTAAPLRGGGTIDTRPVPGMVGYTDLIAGSVPADAPLGWSSVVNPNLDTLYLCFFKGPKGAGGGDIVLHFNDLWMQYGGRRFTPWAGTQGGSDWTFCLGTENSVSAFANGLEYSLAHPKLLGRPTTVEIPAGEERTLSYATLLAGYDESKLSDGVGRLEQETGAVVVEGRGGKSQRFPADSDFASVERQAERLLS